MTFSVTCVCLGWGGMFALLVVYANRALHLTHVDVRLGLLYGAGELGGLLAAAAVPVLIKRLPIGPAAAAFLAANAAALAFLAAAPSTAGRCSPSSSTSSPTSSCSRPASPCGRC